MVEVLVDQVRPYQDAVHSWATRFVWPLTPGTPPTSRCSGRRHTVDGFGEWRGADEVFPLTARSGL